MLLPSAAGLERLGGVPPLPTERIVAVLRAALIGLVLLSISASSAFSSATTALPSGHYEVVEVRQNGAHFAPLDGWPIEITMRAHWLEAWAGCNRVTGSVRLDGGRLTETGEGFYSGIMGCAVPAGMTVSPDVWLRSFFRTRPVVAVDGDRVWLRGSAGSALELVRVP